MSILLTILRALFVLLMAAIGWNIVTNPSQPLAGDTWITMAAGLVIAVVVVCIDILAPARRKLNLFAGLFFGLTVGVVAGYALSFVVQLIVTQITFGSAMSTSQVTSLTALVQFFVYCVTTYLAISFVMQTKDDFRFIIPYVEFRRQTRGNRPMLLDTSVLIDGRIAALVDTGIFENQLIVPRFVILELQQVADSADRLKRNRGRRGLDVLAKLQASTKTEVMTYDTPANDSEGVDQRLIALAKELDARVVTTDFNLQKVAQLAAVDVLNINDMATRLKPEVLPGERMTVRVIKAGEGNNQGVGYLDDGTMVVIEQGRAHMNQDVEFVITNSVQTNAGKMVFGRVSDSVK